MKIGTLKVGSSSEGVRIGEGAFGIALWLWRRNSLRQIYLTVFEKHENIIGMAERFGFAPAGRNERGETVLVKDKDRLDYSEPQKSFPYLNPDFKNGHYLPVEAEYHDKMFPYSRLRNIPPADDLLPVSNGMNKVYIATPFENIQYRPGDIVLIYRIASDNKRYKSAVTSYGTVTKLCWVKSDGREKVPLDEFVI